MNEGMCTVDGCSKPYLARGWCRKHYNRWSRTGSPDDTVLSRVQAGSITVIERLTLTSRQDGDCVVWTGATNQKGYGNIWVDGHSYLTHRAAWIARYGPIPADLLVCHHCDNPPCWRDEHLFLGTPADNTQDMHAKSRSWQTQRTHCPSGHEYTLRNGRRTCRTCKRLSSQIRRLKRRAELAELAEHLQSPRPE